MARKETGVVGPGGGGMAKVNSWLNPDALGGGVEGGGGRKGW
jgi:hypothetical protein